MKKFYIGALFLSALLSTSAQEVLWQKDIKSSTQDFLSQVMTTIDGQYLFPAAASGLRQVQAPLLRPIREPHGPASSK